MKKQILTSVTVVMVLFQLLTINVKGQSRAACVPDNGYWVLITNKNVKNVTTVQFYNNDNQLIYQEEVRNQKCNINRLKTMRCLKKGLDSALFAWNQQKQALYNKTWIAANLKH